MHSLLFPSNFFSSPNKVFSEAKVFFSVGGKIFSREPITYNSKEDCIFEDPKNITIKLYHRIGQYVKLQLQWAAKWILVSEVGFESSESQSLNVPYESLMICFLLEAAIMSCFTLVLMT
jgi:discoidin domain receptor family protein 2